MFELSEAEESVCRRAVVLGIAEALPENEEEKHALLFSLGPLQVEIFTGRDRYNTLKVLQVIAESSERLGIVKEEFCRNHSDQIGLLYAQEYCREERIDFETWNEYFLQGLRYADYREFLKIPRIREWSSTLENWIAAFKLPPLPSPGTPATEKQYAVLRDMMIGGRIKPMTQSQWNRLSKEEASMIIASVPPPGRPELSLEGKKLLKIFHSLSESDQEIITGILWKRYRK